MQGLSSNNPFAAEAGSTTGVLNNNPGAASGYPPAGGSQYYPSVPQPAPGAPQTYPGMYAAAPGAAATPGVPPPAGQYGYAAQSGYPSAAGAGADSGSGPAAYGYPPVAGPGGVGNNSGSTPPRAQQGVGTGWTPESVQSAAAAAPGQFGHYGHLQYAPSFNTAAGTAQAATAAVASLSLGGPNTSDAASSTDGAAGAAPGSFAGQQQLAGTGGWALQGPHLPQQPQQQIVGPHVRFNDYDPASGSWAVSVLVVSSPGLTGSTVQLHYAVNAPASQSAPSQVLDEFMGYKFWRFDIPVVLAEQPGVLNYLVGLVGGQAPISSHSICLPARQEQWRWVFYSCNGFHEDAPQVKYGGISNLWRDLMQRHGQVRYHLQVGGGDQLYADRLFHLPSLQPWLKIDMHEVRAREPFTQGMLQDVEQFYFGSYMAHFAEPAFAAALAAIPFTFSWDDHDIFDGWGSYPDYLQRSAVFQGLFAVARRFYLLFQQHCRYDNATAISATLGEYSYHQVRSIGPNVLLMSPDTRSERTIHQVVPAPGWELMFNDAARRLAASRGCIQHLLVLLPVPIVYSKIPVSESLLASLQGGMRNSKALRDALAKISGDSGAVNVFGEPDILDDLQDHWSAAEHVQERQMIVRRLQTLAEQYSVRVTFMSGDVHVGAYGCFQAHPKQHLRVVDPKFMMQVISSAIGNEPPPGGVITALETSSMASTTMGDTLDKMIKAFPGKKKLKPARNYCEVVPLQAPHTCNSTGVLQPPGGLAFTLRIEQGPPGQPTGIETCTQVAPVLLAGPRGAEAAHYTTAHQGHAGLVGSGSGSVIGQIGALLPGETGQQLQQGVKTMGHKLANFLARV